MCHIVAFSAGKQQHASSVILGGYFYRQVESAQSYLPHMNFLTELNFVAYRQTRQWKWFQH
jgi:hypothetical protein